MTRVAYRVAGYPSGIRVSIESTRHAGSGLTNGKTLEYCGRQSGALFIVPTYNRSLVNEIYNRSLFISGTQVVKITGAVNYPDTRQ